MEIDEFIRRIKKMRKLQGITYATDYENLSIVPNKVEREILLNACSRSAMKRKKIRRLIERANPSDDTVQITLRIHTE